MRTAAFVDAGYLYSAGSKLLSGNALPRNAVQLDLSAALDALRQGRATITIRVGDVARSLKLQHNTPNIVNALGGRKFEAIAGVTVTDRTGPKQGANTTFTYAIDVSPPATSDS